MQLKAKIWSSSNPSGEDPLDDVEVVVDGHSVVLKTVGFTPESSYRITMTPDEADKVAEALEAYVEGGEP